MAQVDIARFRELAIDKEVDCDAMDTTGFTALQLLIFNLKISSNLFPLVESLLQRTSVNVNSRQNNGWSILNAFCFFYEGENLTQFVRLLLLHGADTNALSSRGWNALLSLFFRNYSTGNAVKLETVQLLIDAGVDVHVKMKSGENALLVLCLRHYRHPEFFSMVSLLIQNGSDVNLIGLYGRTPLISISAYYRGDRLYDLVRLLVENNADIKAKDDRGVDAAHYLQGRNLLSFEIKKLLLPPTS